jgi:hypothetical protein
MSATLPLWGYGTTEEVGVSGAEARDSAAVKALPGRVGDR